MFTFRDPKTGMVLILNMATQSDAESEQAELFIFELGKILVAISIMTPTIRRVLLRGLASEIQAFAQAQSLNIVDLVKIPHSSTDTTQKEPIFDLGVWSQAFENGGKK